MINGDKPWRAYVDEVVPPPLGGWIAHPVAGVQSLNNQTWRVGGHPETDVYAVRVADSAAFGNLGVPREVEHQILAVAAAAGIAPELVAYDDAKGIAISRFLTNAPPWPAGTVRDPAHRDRLLAVLARQHQLEADPSWPTVFDQIRSMWAAAEGLNLDIDDVRARLTPRLIDVERRQSKLPGPVLTHHDVWDNNVLDNGDRVWLVDWEFSGSGTGIYDLATISIGADLDLAAEADLLDQFADLASKPWLRAAHDSLHEMKWTVRCFEAAWSLVRSGLVDADAPGDFDFAGHAHRMLDQL